MVNAIFFNEKFDKVSSDSILIEHKSNGFNDRVVCEASKPIRIKNKSGSLTRDIELSDLISVKNVGNRVTNKITIAQKFYDISSMAEMISYQIDMVDYNELDAETIQEKFSSIKSFINILSDQMLSVDNLFKDEAAIILL